MTKRGARSTSTEAVSAAPDPRLRELYAVAPAGFVAARDALARALAADGSADAPRVRRLRRPTVAVWLLNALARERPDAVTALFEAGDRLRRAQVRALGGDPAELRASSAAVHDALATLVTAARELAAGLGREAGAALLGEVERGLRAVATADVAARAPLREGVLERLPEPGGIELLTGLASMRQPDDARRDTERQAPSHEQREPGAGGPRDRREAERTRKAAERSARAEAARRDRERRHAMAEAERRERAHEAAEARAQNAERDLEEAQRRVAAARSDVETARRAALAARASADAAQRDARG
jgi:hypothetical protein